MRGGFSMSNNYALHRFLLMTLDPVYIGTGGYRLGRVDLSIIREPGTNVPKIPGTSLSGAIRQYAAYRYGKLRCAGQKDHCGKSTCPICYTFGSIKGEAEGQRAYAGTVNIFDAHIVFFPVYSMAGPVWVSTKERLEGYRFNITNANPSDTQVVIVGSWWDQPSLNLGWLMLNVEKGAETSEPPGSDFAQKDAWQTVKNRIIFVTEKIFSQMVNSNLEVRTSVSIDPETGAAEEGALFTYEAIPRATWLVVDVVEDNYRMDQFPATENKCKVEEVTNNKGKKERKWVDNAGDKLGEEWKQPIHLVRAGFELAELLGIGGMNTRGFGRTSTVGSWHVTTDDVKRKEVNHA
jgi:CRISPR-associated protein Cmr4